MARKTSATLTDAELRLMNHLWEMGEATVGDLVEAVSDDVNLAYNTVLTMMRILEKKGYVQHTKSGRAFVYSSIVAKSEAQKGALKYFMKGFFNNSAELLVVNLLKDKKIDSKEIKRIKELVDQFDEEEQ